MKMRKMLVFVAVLVMSTLISTTTMSVVLSQQPVIIELRDWLGCAYEGSNEIYYNMNYDIYAYETGSTAILIVSVENNYGTQINVSAVKVQFDWVESYNSTQCSMDSPAPMENNSTRTFMISFEVPETTIDQKPYLHGYKIILEHVNSTTGPKKIVDKVTKSYMQEPAFAVYSANQADAQRLRLTLSEMDSAPSFNSTSARLWVYKAQNETRIGDDHYRQGDFAGAKTHYENALTMYNNAYSAEETRGVKLEDLQTEKLEAEIKNLESWASMVSSLSTTSILLGVATVLFGIGYIIKQLGALKKPVSREATE